MCKLHTALPTAKEVFFVGKRARGEGSIYQRKDGYFVGQYRANGKTRYIYGRVKDDVRQRLNAAIADRDRGLVYDGGHITVADYFDTWLDSIRDNLKARSLERYEDVIRLHIKPGLGTTKLNNLNALQLHHFYRDKLKSGLAANTVKMMHVQIHAALKQAVKWKLIKQNVADDVDAPRGPKKEVGSLTPDQVKKLLSAAKNDRLEALYILAVSAGMRKGEILGLQWSDICFETGTLKVRRTLYRGKTTTPKTKNSKRTIKLPQIALEALRNTTRVEGSPWVFSTANGTPVSEQNLHSFYWKAIKAKAGLPADTRFHCLRHTAATTLMGKNVNPRLVADLLGHSSIKITLDTYSHALPHMGSIAADAMDSFLDEQN